MVMMGSSCRSMKSCVISKCLLFLSFPFAFCSVRAEIVNSPCQCLITIGRCSVLIIPCRSAEFGKIYLHHAPFCVLFVHSHFSSTCKMEVRETGHVLINSIAGQ